MANWSQLPTELLSEIAKRLAVQTDLLRFRSVCSSWRSSVVPRPRNLPCLVPDLYLQTEGIIETPCLLHLYKRTVFLVVPPPEPDHALRRTGEPWLVKVQDNAPGRGIRILNPLSRSQIKPLPEDFPKVIDLSRFRVFELGQEYVLHDMHFWPFANCRGHAGNLYMEKAVFKFLDSETDDFVLLTIHDSGKLAMYRVGDKKWTIIHDTPFPYDDVILFRGDFYAVGDTGIAVVVDQRANVGVVSSPVFGGDKKFLVESSGELLMADMYFSVAPLGGAAEEDDYWYEQFDKFMGERRVRFKVYSLDRGEKKWVELKSLGDRVLFLGNDCTFSASDLDLGSCNNCIIFTDFFYNGGEEDGVFWSRDIGVYDMENCIIAPLTDYPQFSKLFWPPPDWVASRSSGANQVQPQLEEPT